MAPSSRGRVVFTLEDEQLFTFATADKLSCVNMQRHALVIVCSVNMSQSSNGPALYSRAWLTAAAVLYGPAPCQRLYGAHLQPFLNLKYKKSVQLGATLCPKNMPPRDLTDFPKPL